MCLKKSENMHFLKWSDFVLFCYCYSFTLLFGIGFSVHKKLLLKILCRSSHRWYSIKRVILKNFVIFTEKHLWWSLFSITLQCFNPETLLIRDSNMFPVNIIKFLRTSIPKNIPNHCLFKTWVHSKFLYYKTVIC